MTTYTLDFELLDLTLSKGEGGGEGDGELGSSSDSAMHLLRPVLGTLLLCSSGFICCSTLLAVASRHISVHMCMYHVHEQSCYTVHYIHKRRKEEKKDTNRTNTQFTTASKA